MTELDFNFFASILVISKELVLFAQPDTIKNIEIKLTNKMYKELLYPFRIFCNITVMFIKINLAIIKFSPFFSRIIYQSSEMNKTLVYILLVLSLSYSLYMLKYASGYLAFLNDAIFGIIYMWTPALAAMFSMVIFSKKFSVKKYFTFEINKTSLLTFFLPCILIVGITVIGWTITDASPSNGMFFLNSYSDTIPSSIYASLSELLNSNYIYIIYPLLLFVGGPIGGLLNFPIVLGEEFGWRGVLTSYLESQNFWLRNFIIGLIWGAWHFPLILGGYNYGEDIYIGMGFMLVITILFSPLLDYFSEIGKGVVLPTIIHGGFNSIAIFPLLVTDLQNRFLIGVTGLPFIILLVVVNIFIYKKNEIHAL